MNINMNSALNNITVVSQNTDCRIEAFKIINKIDKNGVNEQFIQRNNKINEFLLTIKHFIFGGGKDHRENLKKIILSDIDVIKHQDKTAFIDSEKHAYTELFIASQRFNHAQHLHSESPTAQEIKLFTQLSLNDSIFPDDFPQLAPINVRISEIRKERLGNIEPSLEQHVTTTRGLKHHKVFHYNEQDTHINHAMEAANIFLSTQKERLQSLIGRVIEAVSDKFGHKIAAFSDAHYFRNQEDKKDEIYADDSPLSTGFTPTSYWIGHASTLLDIPLETNDEKQQIHINVITDPIEGDLNALLYPRMTRPGRAINDIPVPNIYMLSHNHMDHFHKPTLQELLKHQPIMLVPEGDKKQLDKMGFKNVYEHNWWQKITIPVSQGTLQSELEITTVPSHHWSGGLHDGHHSGVLGYVVHQKKGDIYFAGDTARLSEEHISEMRQRFNIRSMFQPGGPDEVRKDMETTHQSSADGLWMHFNLMIRNLYDRENFSTKLKDDFISEAKKLLTVYMHTKTYKLGNLHFDDTDKSIERIENSLLLGEPSNEMRSYELQVYNELLAIGELLKFADGSSLNSQDIHDLLKSGVTIPKIGSRTELAS